MIETPSDLLPNSLEIFRKCSETSVWPSDKFWKISGNLWKVVGYQRCCYVLLKICIIKRKLHGRLEIRNFSSRGKKNIYILKLEDRFLTF